MSEPKSNLLRSDPTLLKARNVVYGPSVLNEIRVIPCTTWRDFASSVGVTTAPMLGRVFRGQSDSKWRLQSKWDRYAVQQKEYCKSDLAIAGRHDTPDSFLERFKLNYIDPLGLDTSLMTREHWMALGRHHGLITPLLDWTSSPFVAAFFAFKELLPIDPDLGCLNPLSHVDSDGTVTIWELPLVSSCNNFEHFRFVFEGRGFAHRQRAQSGLFTLVDSPEHDSLDEYLTAKGYLHCLTRYDIPRTEAIIAMQDLKLMNITDSTLFPDGDGAARLVNLGEYLDWAALLEQIRRDSQ